MVTAWTSIELHPRWTTFYRDAPVVEPLAAIMDATWFALLDRAVDVLATGRGLRGRRRHHLRAAAHLAVDFPTWRTPTSSGLADRDAAEIAATFVAASAEATRQPRGVAASAAAHGSFVISARRLWGADRR